MTIVALTSEMSLISMNFPEVEMLYNTNPNNYEKLNCFGIVSDRLINYR
jgi:hypothetical protein